MIFDRKIGPIIYICFFLVCQINRDGHHFILKVVNDFFNPDALRISYRNGVCQLEQLL